MATVTGLRDLKYFKKAASIAEQAKADLKANKRRKHFAKDEIQRASSALARLCCASPLFETVENKQAWVQEHIRELFELSKANLKRKEYRSAIENGLASPSPETSRTPIPMCPEILREDLALIIKELDSMKVGSGKRRAKWTDNRVLTGLALIQEARRAELHREHDFFASSERIAELVSLLGYNVRKSICNWDGLLVVKNKTGSSYTGASEYELTRTLKQHIQDHPTPKDTNIWLVTTGLGSILLNAIPKMNSIEILNSAGFRTTHHLRLNGKTLEITRHARKPCKIKLDATPLRDGTKRVRRRPLSWSKKPPTSGRRLIDEIEAAKPAREALANNGVPIDIERTGQLISGLNKDIESSIKTLTKINPRIVEIDSYRDLWSQYEKELPHLPDKCKDRILKEALKNLPSSVPSKSRSQIETWIQLKKNKATRTTLKTLLDRLDEDGRSRSLFYDGSARTPRLISQGSKRERATCHQNISSKTLDEIILVPQGKIILSADFKALDPHSLAHLSGDNQLLKDLEGDIYETLGIAFGPKGMPLAQLRDRWKTTILAKLYGASTNSLATTLHLKKHAADTLFKQLESRYKEAAIWLDKATEFHKKNSHTSPSITGYIRTGGTPDTVGKNTPVAATSTDIARRFETHCHHQGLEQILSIHDGFSWLVEEGESEQAERVLKQAVKDTKSDLDLSLDLHLSIFPGVSKSARSDTPAFESELPAFENDTG